MKLSTITAVALLALAPMATANTVAAQRRPGAPERQQLSSEIATQSHNNPVADAVRSRSRTARHRSGWSQRTPIIDCGGAGGLPGVVRREQPKSREKPRTRRRDGRRVAARPRPRPENRDATKKAASATKSAVSKTGENITDAWITSRIKTKFMGEEVLRASSINVDTNNHVVTLKGAVPTAAARDKALALAKEVEGVERVLDTLKITEKMP